MDDPVPSPLEPLLDVLTLQSRYHVIDNRQLGTFAAALTVPVLPPVHVRDATVRNNEECEGAANHSDNDQ